jgi:hypothetical protein
VAAAWSSIPGTGMAVDAAYYVTRRGVLVEWQAPYTGGPSPDGASFFIDDNVASISTTVSFSGSQVNGDDVFIVYNNDMLFEPVGHSRRSGFTFIDSNVSP